MSKMNVARMSTDLVLECAFQSVRDDTFKEDVKAQGILQRDTNLEIEGVLKTPI